MAQVTSCPRIRNATQKPQVRYESRVVRTVAPNQPELAVPLQRLGEHTRNFVDYKPLGKLGVTLVMLEPVLRQVLTTNRRGFIPRQALNNFEQELRNELHHAQYADYDIPLQDSFSPLALYGKHDQYLGIRLHEKDYRLVGDRAVVEQYIRDNYDVGKRFLDRNLKRLRPHITIGEVHYENLDIEQREALQADPSAFVIREAYQGMDAMRRNYGIGIEAMDLETITFPETVTLNGLSVFVQQRNA